MKTAPTPPSSNFTPNLKVPRGALQGTSSDPLTFPRRRLRKLRKEVLKYDGSGDGLRTKFMPHKNDDPMITHCKFIATDDSRLLLTSHNLLSISKDEGWGDARELGILVDSPRIAMSLRTEMELLNPSCRDPMDYGRWYGAIAGALDEWGRESIGF